MKKIVLLIFLYIPVAHCLGQITFQKSYGGSGTEFGYSVQQTFDGGYILAGSTTSFGAGSFDVFVIKTDAKGDTVWTKTFGGTGDDRGYDVKQTTDSGYIIVGWTTLFGTSASGIYLIKVDSKGDTSWTKKYSDGASASGYSVQQTDDGGFIIAGDSGDSLNYIDRSCLIKTDANGNILWTKIFGYTWNNAVNSVQQIKDGGYIITGIYVGNQALLIRLNSSGDTLWTKVFYTNNSSQRGYEAHQTYDGGFIIAGDFDGDTYLIKTDYNGNILWTRTFGGAGMDDGHSVFQTSDSGYIVTGYTYSFAAGVQHALLVKIDSTGTLLWAKIFGGASGENSTSVKQTSDGGYIIIGATGSFGMGIEDVYLIKTDANGNSGCNESVPLLIVDTPVVTLQSFPVVISSGFFVSSHATSVSSGGTVTTICSTGITPPTPKSSISLFPNPLTFSSTLHFSIQLKDAELIIFDILGNEMMRKRFSGNEIKIERGNLQSGVYFVKVNSDERQWVQKIIVE